MFIVRGNYLYLQSVSISWNSHSRHYLIIFEQQVGYLKLQYASTAITKKKKI